MLSLKPAKVSSMLTAIKVIVNVSVMLNEINWFTAATVPIWFASCVQEAWRGNHRLAIISLCFAIANAMLSTLGGK